MSRRMVPSVRDAMIGSEMPSIHTRVRRPSPRSSPCSGSRAKIRSARANFPKPSAIIRGSAATRRSSHLAIADDRIAGRSLSRSSPEVSGGAPRPARDGARSGTVRQRAADRPVLGWNVTVIRCGLCTRTSSATKVSGSVHRPCASTTRTRSAPTGTAVRCHRPSPQPTTRVCARSARVSDQPSPSGTASTARGGHPVVARRTGRRPRPAGPARPAARPAGRRRPPGPEKAGSRWAQTRSSSGCITSVSLVMTTTASCSGRIRQNCPNAPSAR